MAGVFLGLSNTLNKYKNIGESRKIGWLPFPQISHEEISVPFISNNSFIENLNHNCFTEPPKLCSDSIECQKKCGPDFICTESNKTIFMNGVVLEKNKKYCLPRHSKALSCNINYGVMNISYDYILKKPKYTCTCKFPDILNGEDCSQLLVCRDPNDARKRAPIIDRTTNKVVDINNVSGETIDFYETLDSGEMRYYCGCKDINVLLTGGVRPMQCIQDPCLPYLDHPPHKSVKGTLDSSSMLNNDGKLNCNCGDGYETTRLIGGKHLPCRAILDDNVLYTNENEITCKNENMRFIPCNNAYRTWNIKGEEIYKCGTNGVYMKDFNAPEAGACTDVCKLCDTIARENNRLCSCHNDVRTMSTCYLTKDKYRTKKCLCAAREGYTFWDVSNDDENGVCNEKLPPCKQMWGKCDPNIHYSNLGPQCCPYLHCTAGYFCDPVLAGFYTSNYLKKQAHGIKSSNPIVGTVIETSDFIENVKFYN
ncbi:hypothetical protein PV326_013427 [Microctonus aethiopoides]|nr:hypothetical protein PV326_013427 [Microctonus aethiopoides]